MQAQEATEVEPPESRSHLVVEERLDVEAVEMKEPVADVVENVALLATHIGNSLFLILPVSNDCLNSVWHHRVACSGPGG